MLKLLAKGKRGASGGLKDRINKSIFAFVVCFKNYLCILALYIVPVFTRLYFFCSSEQPGLMSGSKKMIKGVQAMHHF